tara:strand:+ start:770 stop:1018 length:249 start_codon:yes stop_codon:yes gene_type:complete
MWKIVVFMVMGITADQDIYPLTSNEVDAMVITHYNGKPLDFKTQEKCYAHMWENIEAIKEYASSRFEGKPVRQIICSQQTQI